MAVTGHRSRCGDCWLIREKRILGPDEIRGRSEINNQVSGATYRVQEFLGEGGFGAAYTAFKIDETGAQDGDVVCLKFTNDADVWHET